MNRTTQSITCDPKGDRLLSGRSQVQLLPGALKNKHLTLSRFASCPIFGNLSNIFDLERS